jgi:hypothetical protein
MGKAKAFRRLSVVRSRLGEWGTFYWPLLPPLLVSAVEIASSHLLAVQGWDQKATLDHPETGAATAAASLWLASTWALMAIASAVATFVALFVIRHGVVRKPWWAHVSMLAGIAIAVTITFKTLGGVEPVDALIDENAFHIAMMQAWSHASPGWCGFVSNVNWLFFNHHSNSCGLDEFRLLTGGGIVLALVATPLAAIAVAGLLPDSDGNEPLERAVLTISTSMEKLRYLLYSASAVLVCGILFVKAWSEFPLGVFADSGIKPGSASGDFLRQLSTVMKSFQLFQALWYVALMAAIFLPVALLLQRKAKALALADRGVASGGEAVDSWLSARGLSLSIPAQIQALGAMLAPLLAGPAADIVKSLVALQPH